jgi:hypothetical protein
MDDRVMDNQKFYSSLDLEYLKNSMFKEHRMTPNVALVDVGSEQGKRIKNFVVKNNHMNMAKLFLDSNINGEDYARFNKVDAENLQRKLIGSRTAATMSVTPKISILKGRYNKRSMRYREEKEICEFNLTLAVQMCVY